MIAFKFVSIQQVVEFYHRLIQNADFGLEHSNKSKMASSLKDINATKVELEDEEFLIDDNGDIVDDGNTTSIN